MAIEFQNHFGKTSAYSLTGAILIYEDADRQSTVYVNGGRVSKANAIATVHDIEQTPGGPVILAGRCVTWEAIQQLSLSLANREHRKLDILPPQLLALSMTHMIWHRPASRHTLWFAPPGGPGTFGKQTGRLKKVSGETFPQPHLVFVAQPGQLHVFALRTTRRPAPTTPLYHAPHMNVYENGSMCVGSARIPNGLGPELIGQYEQAFFDSNFTHTNHRNVEYRGGASAMWPAVRKLRKFPPHFLVPTKKTFGDLFRTKADQEVSDE